LLVFIPDPATVGPLFFSRLGVNFVGKEAIFLAE
jgi:hypothetical protein